ncbi:MAG TPA: GGDEF domain-containing protein [Polyangiaceae bacterium]|nr:GGDEF domain-containing protein [Polyangiaceae bacterium]
MEPAASGEQPSVVEGKEGEAALDSVGALLHVLGKVSFDIGDQDADSIRRTFERWAQHVLVGAPLGERGGEGPESSRGVRRDWGALRNFVASHRRREVAYVVKALTDLRKAAWAFIGAFARALGEDGQSDATVRAQLGRLEDAVRSNDTDALRREASSAIDLVGAAIEKRAERHRAQLGELASHIRNLSLELENAKKQGQMDAMTRIYNRACLDDYVARTSELCAVFTQPACLMMLDVDRFKQVNDVQGHAAGDEALKVVADRLVRLFPRRGDLVARFGGDEFAVVLRDVRLEDARMLAQRLVEAVRGSRFEHQGRQVVLSVSVGVAEWRMGDTSETWFARADAALYSAKQAGRDRWADGSSAVTARSSLSPASSRATAGPSS